MTIIGIVNRKGGAGKSTTCAYLAMCLLQKGSVAVVDADEEKSLHTMYEALGLPYPVFESSLLDIEDTVFSIEGADYILIDTPPNQGEAIYGTCVVSDIILIPVNPSGMDLARLNRTIKPVRQIIRDTSKRAYLLLTRVQKHTNSSRDAVETLKGQDLPLLESKISHSVKYVDFKTPEYLEEYEAVVRELGLHGNN